MKRSLQFAAGILLAGIFAFLALRGVKLSEVLETLAHTRYGYIVLAVALLMASHFLRALRWKLFLAPIRALGAGGLFSALLIGYAANTFVPAHLGELLRAAVVGRKHGMFASAVFASIVLERIVDVVSLVAATALVILLYPFPGWVVQSAYVMFAGALLLMLGLIGFKRYESRAERALRQLLRPLPPKIGRTLETTIVRFFAGLQPLAARWHYAAAFLLSIGIWVCYALCFHACLLAFDFPATYGLPWYAALAVLVVSTISVVIPSSPGYVGTFHYLCQVSLMMFGVPAAAALSFALITHAVSVLPVTAAGLVMANVEGFSILRAARQAPDPVR
jgi:uncharacterized protein (TIRG00374 family)